LLLAEWRDGSISPGAAENIRYTAGLGHSGNSFGIMAAGLPSLSTVLVALPWTRTDPTLSVVRHMAARLPSLPSLRRSLGQWPPLSRSGRRSVLTRQHGTVFLLLRRGAGLLADVLLYYLAVYFLPRSAAYLQDTGSDLYTSCWPFIKRDRCLLQHVCKRLRTRISP
jgi:hypothetical protein